MKIALADQIAEVEREIGLRRMAYPVHVARATMSQEDMDRHMTRIEAVRATLLWLQQNRAAVVEGRG